MPNWVNNKFAVEGDPHLVQDFINEATDRGKTNEFSFQNLYPMPDELNITCGSNLTDEEKEQQKINLQKYGCEDWYSWRNKHWGTKWDCVDPTYVSMEKDGMQHSSWSFNTAWDMPRGLVRYLTKKFPDLVFDLQGRCESGWKERFRVRNDQVLYSQYIESSYEDEYWEDA